MVYLLTIRGSAEWRLCTGAVSVVITESATGTVRTFWPGLEDPQIEETADSADGMEVPVRAVLPPEAWEALTGTDPSGWTAEIAEWTPGTDWRARTVRVDGRIDQPVYATVHDPVEFSVIENVWEDRSLFPPPGQQAGSSTWPVSGSTVFPAESEGMWYPWVFGCPGYVYDSDTFTDYYGWPVVLVEIDASTGNNFDTGSRDAAVLIAGHVCGFSSVKLYNRTTGLSATVATTSTTDLLGNVVTIASVPGTDLAISSGDELWASAAVITGSGVAADPGKAMRGAGQVVRWLLEHSTIRFDRGRLSLLARLDRFKVDFYVNEPVSAWAIIQDTILANGVIPAFWRRSSWGYYLSVQPFDTVAPLLQIRDEDGWERDGALTCSSGQDVVTDATIVYAEDKAQGANLRKLTYSARPQSGANVNPYMASAYAAIKARKAMEVQAPGVQDPATARLALDLLVRRRSTIVRSGAYVCPRTGTGAEVGMVVAVTDSGVNLSARLCWIAGVEVSTTETRIMVETLPDLQRSAS